MPFDVQGARDAGYSNDEIVGYLIKRRGKDFDLQGARSAGWDDEEIIHYLDTGKGFDRSSAGRPQAAARGFNTGLANVLGAPVDATNWLLDKIGVPTSDKPFLGSDSIKSGLDTAGGALSQALGGNGDRLTYDNVSDLPPIERPFAIGGEAIGSSVPLAAAPLAMARAGIAGPKVLAPVMEMARNSPGLFAAGEAAGAAGAAQGGALAEVFDPGDQRTRMLAEIAGSIANPAGLITRGFGAASTRVKDALASRMTAAGRRQRAADYIRRAFAASGENPEDVLRALNTDIPEGVDLKLTVGQWSNSPTLLAIEKKVAESKPEFGSRAEAGAKASLEDLRQAALHTEKFASVQGDPSSLTAAAKARATYFDELVGGRMNVAQQRLDKALARIDSGGLEGQRMASREAYDILEGALSDARKVESDLWSAVPRDAPVTTDNLRGAFEKVRGQLLDEEKLPAPFEAFSRRLSAQFAGPYKQISTGDLLRLRSRALELSREARGNRQWSLARHLTDLAGGALDDLATVPGASADAARDFSRTLNDKFTRTFAGYALGEKPTGASRIDPELILERAFGSGRNPGLLRMRELQGAAAFPSGDAAPMLNAQEKFLRSAFDKSVDPATGNINQNKLASFLRDNSSLLDQFPGLRQQLATAGERQGTLDYLRGLPSRASQVMKRNSAFGKLLRFEGKDDPVGVVAQALNSPRDYNDLVNLARKADRKTVMASPQGQAMAGLRSATLEAVARRATDEGGNFSFDRFRNALTGGERPFLDQMVERGQMEATQAARMRTILTRAERIQKALESGSRRGEIFDSPDMLTDFVVRSVGAHLGALAPGNQSLVQASAGSRYAQNFFNKIPQTRITEALVEIMENKELARAVLERTTSPARKAAVQRQLNAALIQAGLIPDDSETSQRPQWMDTQTGATVQGGQ